MDGQSAAGQPNSSALTRAAEPTVPPAANEPAEMSMGMREVYRRDPAASRAAAGAVR